VLLTRLYACSAVGRDLYAYLTLMVNPASDASLNRVFKTPPRGIADRGWSALRTDMRKASTASNLAALLFAGLDDVSVDGAVVQEVHSLLAPCCFMLLAPCWNRHVVAAGLSSACLRTCF
jgi:superfamily I DNA/RNA helicase